MTDEKNDRKPIEPPVTDKKRALARTVAEGVVGLFPGGGIVTGALRVMHPAKAEQDRAAWVNDISERTNEHDERLDHHSALLSPQKTITGTAERLVVALAQDCPDGLGQKHYTLDALAELLPGKDRQEIEDAVYELEACGLVYIRRTISGPWDLSLTPEFYEQVDHQVMGWETPNDAIEVARLMLADDTGNAPTLHEKTGWHKRRFNPALRYLLPLFPDGHIRKVLQPEYVTLGVALAAEDKAALRRFIRRCS